MENKLTLEHLAPYLPYELTGISTFENVGTEKIIGLSEAEITTEYDAIDYSEFMPFFLPLSALTETTQFEGREIAPIVELAKIAHPSKKWQLFMGGCISDGHASPHRFLYHGELNCFISREDRSSYPLINQLALFQYLHKLHFDLYNLIDRGLAIDKRTTL